MSSFVIAKREYVKAAGFIAATVEHKNYYRDPVLRMWNRRENRVYSAEDVRRDFCRLYQINALAVQAQYNDRTPETDPEDYTADFMRVKAEAARLMQRGYTVGNAPDTRRLQTAVYALINFMFSALYQIEGDEYERRALRIMNKYYRGLYAVLMRCDHLTDDDVKSWGSFEVFDEPANLQEEV